ncbi:MAG: beta-ketoacyl-[acyl-carrier-protein] synthase family protein [Pseudomonadota bacterium]
MSAPRQKILITGLGAVSAAGIGVAETLLSFEEGKRNAGRVTIFESELEYPVFEVRTIPPEFSLNNQRTLSLALVAVDEALQDASLGKSELSRLRLGVCLGTTVASQLNDLDFYKSYRTTGSAPMEPVNRYVKGNLAEFVARRINPDALSLTVVNACSSGTDAIGVALAWLKSGFCDIVISGGADELSPIPLCGFGSLGIVSHDLCSPFDKDRRGLNLGEGAGILIMETEESAGKRGKRSDLYALGYASASDAYHLTSPRPDGRGLEAAILRALACSNLHPESIDFVNAHGTATIENDKVEGRVLAKVFGPDLKVLSTKGFTGHTLGAAGGLEAVFTAAGLRHGWIPASIGFRNRDEGVSIVPVRQKTTLSGSFGLSTSLAFGGNNSALVLGREGWCTVL